MNRRFKVEKAIKQADQRRSKRLLKAVVHPVRSDVQCEHLTAALGMLSLQ